MLKQAFDFKDESDCLYNILNELSNCDFETKTQFKKWTSNTILSKTFMKTKTVQFRIYFGFTRQKLFHSVYCNFLIQ